MKLSSYKEDYAADKVLLVGLPKSGKSTLAAALATRFNLYWIDTDAGVKTLMKLPQAAQDRINVFVIPDSASHPIAAATLAVLFKSGKMNMCHAHGAHECAICKKVSPEDFSALDISSLGKEDILVLDSASQLGRSILAHVTRKEAVDYKPLMDDWGSLRKYTEFFASQFQALRCNFVCITHTVEVELEDGKFKLVPDFGSKAMSAAFAKAFDHVVYLETKNGKHVAGSLTSYSMKILTGSRTDFDISKLPEPSLIPIFDGSHQKTMEDKSAGAIALNSLKGIKV